MNHTIQRFRYFSIFVILAGFVILACSFVIGIQTFTAPVEWFVSLEAHTAFVGREIVKAACLAIAGVVLAGGGIMAMPAPWERDK